ncbi:MAG: hypothetical protein ACP5NB_09555, partial [Chloroflexia bacterium]
MYRKYSRRVRGCLLSFLTVGGAVGILLAVLVIVGLLLLAFFPGPALGVLSGLLHLPTPTALPTPTPVPPPATHTP